MLFTHTQHIIIIQHNTRIISNSHLPGDCDFIKCFIPQWALFLVSIVKCDCNSGFGDSCLSTFINKLLQAVSPDLYNNTRISVPEILTSIFYTIIAYTCNFNTMNSSFLKEMRCHVGGKVKPKIWYQTSW